MELVASKVDPVISPLLQVTSAAVNGEITEAADSVAHPALTAHLVKVSDHPQLTVHPVKASQALVPSHRSNTDRHGHHPVSHRQLPATEFLLHHQHHQVLLLLHAKNTLDSFRMFLLHPHKNTQSYDLNFCSTILKLRTTISISTRIQWQLW